MFCRTKIKRLLALQTQNMLPLAVAPVLLLLLVGCGGANTPPTDPNAPVAYADILARFQQIRSDYGTIDQRLQSYKTYADSLVGKRAITWNAWVMNTGKANDATNFMTLLLQDPAGQDADHIVYASSDQKTSVGEPDTTTFAGLSASQIANLKPGQQLSFSGVISAAYQQLSFSAANFTPIAPTPTTAATTPAPLPADLEIGLQEIPAELLPQQTITINAAGHVHIAYNYLDQAPNKTTPDPVDKTVPVAQVADLLILFNQINYNALHSYLLESDCSIPSGIDRSTMTSFPVNTWIKQNGGRHDVYTNSAVSCIPAKLHMVEDAIRQVAGVNP